MFSGAFTTHQQSLHPCRSDGQWHESAIRFTSTTCDTDSREIRLPSDAPCSSVHPPLRDHYASCAVDADIHQQVNATCEQLNRERSAANPERACGGGWRPGEVILPGYTAHSEIAPQAPLF